MNILGISAFYHDSAAALVCDGEIIAAAQEERFSRKKHDHRFPKNAANFCLREGGITSDGLDHVIFYDKPLTKFERLLETYLRYAPSGINSFNKAMPLWLKEKLWMPDTIKKELDGYKGKVLFCDHHESHAASAFYPSPFEEAAVLTIDGVGEWTTASWGVGNGNDLQIKKEIRFPHSLGLLYSAFTYYTGFKVNSGEYKVMGLAPYGEPKYVDLIYEHLIDLKEDGSFRLNMKYFNYCAGLTMTNKRFDALFGGPPRKPESMVAQREMDLAHSVQDVTEEIMLRMARHIAKISGQKNLCLAGGVALNCVANGKILREEIFDDLWIQPASGDAGGALGAALYAHYRYLDKPRSVNGTDTQSGSLLGPAFTNEEIKTFLDENGYVATHCDGSDLFKNVAQLIADENVIGWFQGRMEFGARALGGRSILGDARSTKMQSIMNLKIKYRESFRPFAPSVLRESVSEYFDIDYDSPYMLLVAPVNKNRQLPMTEEQENLFGIEKLKVPRSDLPAITHVDYPARIQTVTPDANPRYYPLIKAFEELTGSGVLINTSFNVRGEPIVCTPEDAYRCFMRSDMDYLVMEDYLLDKRNQPEWHEKEDWRSQFELD